MAHIQATQSAQDFSSWISPTGKAFRAPSECRDGGAVSADFRLSSLAGLLYSTFVGTGTGLSAVVSLPSSKKESHDDCRC